MWRRGWDSNPRYGLSPYNGLANRRLQPLGHPSTNEWIDAVYAKATTYHNLAERCYPEQLENEL